jgi:hypothetical protein
MIAILPNTSVIYDIKLTACALPAHLSLLNCSTTLCIAPSANSTPSLLVASAEVSAVADPVHSSSCC